MEISEKLLCLISGRVQERNGSYVIEVPDKELRLGDVEEEAVYRIALFPSQTGTHIDSGQEQERERDVLEPPVEDGETRIVDIEGIGDQGDGITRVERGFVVIVPGTDKGDRVRIQINQVRENVAFAEVIEELEYYS